MAPTKPGFSAQWPLLALAGTEWRIGWRTAAFRLMAFLSFVWGCTAGGAPGQGAALAAYNTAEAAWQFLGFVAILWMALAAVRETTFRTNILIFSKPQPGERLALAKFLGAFLQILAFLLLLFAGSIVSRIFSGGGLLGVEVYLIQYARVAGVLFFAASASFTLALLLDTPLAGALVAIYWILTLAGKAFLGKFYFPAYTQNLTAYLALGGALLCITLQSYRRARRGDLQPASWIRIGAPLCLLLTGWLFWVVIRDGHDSHTRLNPAMERMGQQDTDLDKRAAGFQLPDQHGRLTGLSDFPGRILLIAIWSPEDPDSILLLDRLNTAQAQYGAQGVQAIAICISEDNGAAGAFARGEHLLYPAVADWGASSVPDKAETSPLSSAYRAASLPRIYVTDRRRRIRAILKGSDSYDGLPLEQAIKDRLAAEPH